MLQEKKLSRNTNYGINSNENYDITVLLNPQNSFSTAPFFLPCNSHVTPM